MHGMWNSVCDIIKLASIVSVAVTHLDVQNLVLCVHLRQIKNKKAIIVS